MKNQDLAVLAAVDASIQMAGREEAARPWVINLRAAMTSLRSDVAPLAEHQELRVYEIARLEEGRPRHRLRAGFFGTRAAAEAILPAIRRAYPAAFAAPAMREDLVHAGGFDLAALAPSTPIERDDDDHEVAADVVLELLEDAPQPAEVESDAPASTSTEVAAALGLASDPAAPDVAPRSEGPAPTSEIEPEWFALELLTTSVRPAPQSLPTLDIFSAYELYVIKLRNDAGPVYSVRLGFFRERISASQVASYIRGAYPDVRIAPVAGDEQQKRVRIRTEPEEEVGIDTVVLHAPDSNVIELAQARHGKPPGAAMPRPGDRNVPRTSRVNGQHVNGAGDTSGSGKHKTLGQLLVEEARQVALSETAVRRMPPHKQNLFNRLVGRLKR